MMSNLHETLLALVSRAFFENKSEENTFAIVDWFLFLSLASAQGVKGLVWEAIETLIEEGTVDVPVDDKMEWIGNIRASEVETKRMRRLSAEFAEALKPCQCVVLKGVDYARYWPNPIHREFGDLDIYSGEGIDTTDEWARAIGAQVEDNKTSVPIRLPFLAGDRQKGVTYKHSHICYKGLKIENHRWFTSHKGSRQGMSTEQFLKDTLGTEFSFIGKSSLLSPNPTFTALFMLRHSQLHFLAEGIRLRHILDWLFFLRSEEENIDWDRVGEGLQIMQMETFAGIMTVFGIKYLGFSRNGGINSEAFNVLIKKNTIDDKLLERFKDDVLGEQPEIYDMRLSRKALRIIRRMRRMVTFRKLLNESYLSKVWQSLVYNSITGLTP